MKVSVKIYISIITLVNVEIEHYIFIIRHILLIFYLFNREMIRIVIVIIEYDDYNEVINWEMGITPMHKFSSQWLCNGKSNIFNIQYLL